MKRLKTDNTDLSRQLILPALSPINSLATNNNQLSRYKNQSNFIRNRKKANSIILSKKIRRKKGLVNDCISQSLRQQQASRSQCSSLSEMLSKIIQNDIKNRKKNHMLIKQPISITRLTQKEGQVKTQMMPSQQQIQQILQKQTEQDFLSKYDHRKKRFKYIKFSQERIKKTLSFQYTPKNSSPYLQTHKLSLKQNTTTSNQLEKIATKLPPKLKHFQKGIQIKTDITIDITSKHNQQKNSLQNFRICQWQQNQQNSVEEIEMENI